MKMCIDTDGSKKICVATAKLQVRWGGGGNHQGGTTYVAKKSQSLSPFLVFLANSGDQNCTLKAMPTWIYFQYFVKFP